MNVAIIGAGPLGRWLAVAAARAGFRVTLEDVMPANLHHAQEYIRRQFGPESLNTTGSAKVEFASTIEDAVRTADLVVDCVPDELESKLEILCLLDRMAPPRTVIATPLTRLSISDLASCTYRADKCVAIVADARRLTDEAADEPGPRALLIRTPAQTTPATIAQVEQFWQALGFAPRFETDPAMEPSSAQRASSNTFS